MRGGKRGKSERNEGESGRRGGRALKRLTLAWTISPGESVLGGYSARGFGPWALGAGSRDALTPLVDS